MQFFISLRPLRGNKYNNYSSMKANQKLIKLIGEQYLFLLFIYIILRSSIYYVILLRNFYQTAK